MVAWWLREVKQNGTAVIYAAFPSSDPYALMDPQQKSRPTADPVGAIASLRTHRDRLVVTGRDRHCRDAEAASGHLGTGVGGEAVTEGRPTVPSLCHRTSALSSASGQQVDAVPHQPEAEQERDHHDGLIPMAADPLAKGSQAAAGRLRREGGVELDRQEGRGRQETEPDERRNLTGIGDLGVEHGDGTGEDQRPWLEERPSPPRTGARWCPGAPSISAGSSDDRSSSGGVTPRRPGTRRWPA